MMKRYQDVLVHELEPVLNRRGNPISWLNPSELRKGIKVLVAGI